MLEYTVMILFITMRFGISNYMSDKRSSEKYRHTIQVGMMAGILK